MLILLEEREREYNQVLCKIEISSPSSSASSSITKTSSSSTNYSNHRNYIDNKVSKLSNNSNQHRINEENIESKNKNENNNKDDNCNENDLNKSDNYSRTLKLVEKVDEFQIKNKSENKKLLENKKIDSPFQHVISKIQFSQSISATTSSSLSTPIIMKNMNSNQNKNKDEIVSINTGNCSLCNEKAYGLMVNIYFLI